MMTFNAVVGQTNVWDSQFVQLVTDGLGRLKLLEEQFRILVELSSQFDDAELDAFCARCVFIPTSLFLENDLTFSDLGHSLMSDLIEPVSMCSF